MQSFMDRQGGLVAKAGVAWFDWMMKNSTEVKEFLLGKGSSIAKAGWQVQTRHLSQMLESNVLVLCGGETFQWQATE